MRLAKDQYGRIGRVLRQDGLAAVIDPATISGNFGDVYISPRSIEQDEINARESDTARRAAVAQNKARMAYNQAQEQAMMAQMQGRARIEQIGASRAEQSMNAKLRRHFMGQAAMCENDRVASTVRADFSETEQIASGGVMRPINRRADFDIMQTVGNPLTRNGCYGPATDYDYILSGDEMVNQRAYVPSGEQIVGGTMLGRYNGQNRTYSPPQMGRRRRAARPRLGDWADDYTAQFQAEEDISNYDLAMSTVAPAPEPAVNQYTPMPDSSFTPDATQAAGGAGPASTDFIPDMTQASAGAFPSGIDATQSSAGTATATAPTGEVAPQDFWDKLWANTEQQLVGQGSGALSTAIIGSIVPQGSRPGAPGSAPGQIPGTNPISVAVNGLANSLGVNPWILVGGAGLLSIGIIVSLMRTSGRSGQPVGAGA